MDTSFANIRREKSELTVISRVWNKVVGVPENDKEIEPLARSAAAIAVVTLAIGVVASVLEATPPVSLYFALSIGGVVMLAALYMLNRRGHYGIAALGLIGVFALLPLVGNLGRERNISVLDLTALISSIAILLSSLFFPRRAWGQATTAIIAALYVSLPLVSRSFTFLEALVPAIGLVAIGLISEINRLQRTLAERREQASASAEIAALRASEAALKKAYSDLERNHRDLAVELEATVNEFLCTTKESERAKENAERANNVKAAFLASMSHELRTPLNAIINFSRFVARGTAGPVNEGQRDMLDGVVASGQHLLSLINDVLDMSKIESGSLSLYVEDNVDLNAICLDALAMGQSLVTEKPVEIRANVAEDIPLIVGDRQRILQILLNIVSNACKFTQAGLIELTVTRQGEEVVMAVKDSGPGIRQKDWGLIFEPFKQTESGIQQGHGTGLGMPITKNLAEAHGGRIWLDSTVGVGTTFFVALPIKARV